MFRRYFLFLCCLVNPLIAQSNSCTNLTYYRDTELSSQIDQQFGLRNIYQQFYDQLSSNKAEYEGSFDYTFVSMYSKLDELSRGLGQATTSAIQIAGLGSDLLLDIASVLDLTSTASTINCGKKAGSKFTRADVILSLLENGTNIKSMVDTSVEETIIIQCLASYNKLSGISVAMFNLAKNSKELMNNVENYNGAVHSMKRLVKQYEAELKKAASDLNSTDNKIQIINEYKNAIDELCQRENTISDDELFSYTEDLNSIATDVESYEMQREAKIEKATESKIADYTTLMNSINQLSSSYKKPKVQKHSDTQGVQNSNGPPIQIETKSCPKSASYCPSGYYLNEATCVCFKR